MSYVTGFMSFLTHQDIIFMQVKTNNNNLNYTTMWRSELLKPLKNAASCNLFFQIQRGLHSRNKKAKEYIGKGWSAIQEVDRVLPYTEPEDELLIPLLKSAKQNFELALEVDNLNTQARLWLARLHLKYCVPGACIAVGAALLVEAANMGNADAQYELFCQLRTGETSITKDKQAIYYLDKAINQLQPDALFVLGAMHLGGDCVKKDLELAAWCFQKATQKGHVGAAIAYGALIFKDTMQGKEDIDVWQWACWLEENKWPVTRKKTPEETDHVAGTGKVTSEASSKIHNRLSKRKIISSIDNARNQFEVAANAGNDLAFIWLNRLHEQEENEVTD